MQTIAEYSEHQKKALETIQGFINNNDAKGLSSCLQQEQQHQLQAGGRLNDGRRRCNDIQCCIGGGSLRCGFCVLDY